MKALTIISALVLAGVVVGCKAGEPGKMEKSVMKEVKHEVTIGGKDDKNPIQYSEDAVKEGGEHFQHHCGICHGLDGQNTGVPFATKMQPPVADLSAKDVQDYTDGQLKWIIANGIAPSGMPGWKDILTDEEMWNLVRYIRHLPAKGSLGPPPVYQEGASAHEHAEEHSHSHKK